MSANNIENVIFYFPYRNVGGVSILFLGFSKLLTFKFNVFLVDFRDGYIGSRVPEGVNFMDIEKVEKYPDNSVVVFQSVPPWRIKDLSKFTNNTSFFYWNLHPRNFEPFNVKFNTEGKNILHKFVLKALMTVQGYNKKKLKNVIRYFSESNALFFMDEENFLSTKNFFPDIDIKEKYLPCFLIPDSAEKKFFSTKKTYNFCWVGRIVDFKVHILNHLLERLSIFNPTDFDFYFTIIGTGDGIKTLQDHIANLNILYKINFIEDLPHEQLGHYLIQNCDVLFAMGLSALEGASRKIPTFLVDFSFSPIQFKYRFKYIFEQEKFNLGCQINDSHREADSSFESKILNVISSYESIADQCYNYWQSNHSGNKTVEIFKESLAFNTTSKSDIFLKRMNFPDLFTFLYFSMVRLRASRNIGKKVHGFRYPLSN